MRHFKAARPFARPFDPARRHEESTPTQTEGHTRAMRMSTAWPRNTSPATAGMPCEHERSQLALQTPSAVFNQLIGEGGCEQEAGEAAEEGAGGGVGGGPRQPEASRRSHAAPLRRSGSDCHHLPGIEVSNTSRVKSRTDLSEAKSSSHTSTLPFVLPAASNSARISCAAASP